MRENYWFVPKKVQKQKFFALFFRFSKEEKKSYVPLLSSAFFFFATALLECIDVSGFMTEYILFSVQAVSQMNLIDFHLCESKKITIFYRSNGVHTITNSYGRMSVLAQVSFDPYQLAAQIILRKSEF